MAKFEPEGSGKNWRRERQGGEEERRFDKTDPDPVLAADTDSLRVRIEWVSSDGWNWEEWELAEDRLPKQEKPTGDRSRGALITSQTKTLCKSWNLPAFIMSIVFYWKNTSAFSVTSRGCTTHRHYVYTHLTLQVQQTTYMSCNL